MKLDMEQARRKREAGRALAPQFLAKHLTLSQPGGTDYAHHSTMSLTPPPPPHHLFGSGVNVI